MTIFDVSSSGTPNNFVVFNDDNSDPYYRCEGRFPTKRELEEFEAVLPESLGINDYETLIGREVFVLKGEMFPSNEQVFAQGRAKLRKLASVMTSQADPYSDNGYVPYKWSEEVPKQLMVKWEYVDMPETIINGIIQPFTLIGRVKYPVITSQNSKSGTITMGASSGYGGFQIPFTVPLQIATSGQSASNSKYPITYPVIWGGSSSGANSQGAVTLTNAGDLPAYPTIQINGPINNPTLTNVTTGKSFTLNVQLPTTSSTAVLSYNQSSTSITANGADAYGNYTGTLFRVYPGPNTFTLTGSSVGSGAGANISFFDTWPLS